MLRTVLTFIIHRPWRQSAPCCAPAAAARRRVLILPLAAVALLPLAARPEAGQPPEPGVVAEALFLCDPLPPGGRDLNLSVAFEPDGAPGGGAAAISRLQLAVGLGERLGVTADVALDPATGRGLHSPGASLKALLRDPAGGALGVAASLDLLGASHSLAESEAAAGLGLIRSLGRLTLRAGASLASPLGGWTPHLHGGGSAALALGARWRVLAEAIVELGEGAPLLAAGPTLKVALGDATSLAAGALLDLRAPARAPSFVLQVTQGL